MRESSEQCGDVPCPDATGYEQAVRALDQRILKAIHFMQANLDRPLKLPAIARSAGLSLSRFSHLFRTQTGLTPRQMLRRIRAERARLLLSTTKAQVKQVAGLVGLPSVSEFVRAFRASSGVTPGEFRRTASSTLVHSKYV
jgi:transcriptional regulator GlxA family with amidase domain